MRPYAYTLFFTAVLNGCLEKSQWKESSNNSAFSSDD